MEELEIFQSIAADPYRYAAELKQETGKRFIGYFCSYAPEELIVAAGAVPFRIFGTGGNSEAADEHIQAYVCSVVRGSLGDALTGRLFFLDGTVFPHTCDSMQRLSDIWRLSAGFALHWDVVLPVKLNTDSAVKYYTETIAKFRSELAAGLGIEISDSDLLEASQLLNRIRRHLVFLYGLLCRQPGMINGKDLHAVVKAAMVMDRRELARLLDNLVEKLEAGQKESAPAGKRVFLSGGVCNHPDIFGIIEEGGGLVVGDDLCTGLRSFKGEIDESAEPVAAISKRYATRIVCPAKHISTTSRGEGLVEAVRSTGADGVIFLLLKFCDPHGFDYPYLKQCLDQEGIPNTLLEIEESLPPEGQLRTRIETFVSML